MHQTRPLPNNTAVMPLGAFANGTSSACTSPMLDESLFGTTGGYQAGRYCGLGAFPSGDGQLSCCFPCPIQDWLYPPEWQSNLRVPNYLSIFSLILCSFLLLSFLVLPPAQTHRHYLSIGLLIPVLLISLSFAIPVSSNPNLCYDAITPLDMHDSMSCAWTGSFVTLGGLGCVIWVFLRSLWLFLRIVYDIAPGRKFMFGSIAAGTFLPIVFLIAVLSSTGFSYRMGQTCLPNHEAAFSTFWAWLVLFAALGFILQAITTSYCVWVYARTLKRERSFPSHNRGYGSAMNKQANLRTWSNVKKLFILQWRNILVSVFVLVGSLVFFIVFWTQDSRLGRVFNDPNNLRPVKTWLICQTLSRGYKTECRKYVKDFTVNEAAVVTSLIFASLIGIEIFVLLFRVSMLHAWVALFKRLHERTSHALGRPQAPELTSFETPEKCPLSNPHLNTSKSRVIEGLNTSLSPKCSANEIEKDLPRWSAPLPKTPGAPTPPPKFPFRTRQGSDSIEEHQTSTPHPSPAPPTPPKFPLQATQNHDFAQDYQPLSPYPPPTPTRTPPHTSHRPPSIQISSPPPHLSTFQIHRSNPPSPRSPFFLPSPHRHPVPPPRTRTHRPVRMPSAPMRMPSAPTRSGTYRPSRPAPSLPMRRSTVTGRVGARSAPNTPTTGGSGSGNVGAGVKERSWRNSTLSALDRIVEGLREVSGGGGGGGVKRGGSGKGSKKRIEISAPVQGSFKHVDGAFVDGGMSPFGVQMGRSGWGGRGNGSGEGIGRAV